MSRHIGDQENELGVLLFERQTAGVRLKRAGDLAVRSVKRRFLEFEEVVRTVVLRILRR